MTLSSFQFPSKRLLESLLGSEETQILHAIERGFRDCNSIHLLTGIPLLCVHNKIAALVGLGLIKKEANEFAPLESVIFPN
jgi:hypothetical protein